MFYRVTQTPLCGDGVGVGGQECAVGWRVDRGRNKIRQEIIER